MDRDIQTQKVRLTVRQFISDHFHNGGTHLPVQRRSATHVSYIEMSCCSSGIFSLNKFQKVEKSILAIVAIVG